MATANRRNPGTRGTWARILLALVVTAGLLGWFYREPLRGYSTTGAAFAARTACSCRYVAGRSLEDCEKDLEPGMALVFVSEDEDARSVTASVPLLARDTARYRPGFGCLLDPWEG
jgi:hypothetical protein